MKTVFSTTDPTEASIFSALLGEEGISSKIEGEGGAYYAVGMPTSAFPLSLTVEDNDAEAATRIVKAILEKRSKAAHAGRPAGGFEGVVESNRRRSRWVLILVYCLPIAIILGVAALVGGRQVLEAPAWILGALVVSLLVGAVLCVNRRKH